MFRELFAISNKYTWLQMNEMKETKIRQKLSSLFGDSYTFFELISWNTSVSTNIQSTILLFIYIGLCVWNKYPRENNRLTLENL